ncbi:hypothetical protein CEXT_767241 [Caerostris extrusa]|uniref:Transmembrane protein n=1 Tax=Caerostris extrusa TaxID=172846 RepID=A0AAV4P6N1_CAEEX|nr:hypothetical protein CEXT_767241 [Caerostris extrusa]
MSFHSPTTEHNFHHPIASTPMNHSDILKMNRLKPRDRISSRDEFNATFLWKWWFGRRMDDYSFSKSVASLIVEYDLLFISIFAFVLHNIWHRCWFLFFPLPSIRVSKSTTACCVSHRSPCHFILRQHSTIPITPLPRHL